MERVFDAQSPVNSQAPRRSTLTESPDRFGATDWSSRCWPPHGPGEGTSISHASIARIWHRFGVQPWRAQTFKFSTDPPVGSQDLRVLLDHHPQALRRGNFPTVADLIGAIERFINA